MGPEIMLATQPFCFGREDKTLSKIGRPVGALFMQGIRSVPFSSYGCSNYSRETTLSTWEDFQTIYGEELTLLADSPFSKSNRQLTETDRQPNSEVIDQVEVYLVFSQALRSPFDEPRVLPQSWPTTSQFTQKYSHIKHRKDFYEYVCTQQTVG